MEFTRCRSGREVRLSYIRIELPWRRYNRRLDVVEERFRTDPAKTFDRCSANNGTVEETDKLQKRLGSGVGATLRFEVASAQAELSSQFGQGWSRNGLMEGSVGCGRRRLELQAAMSYESEPGVWCGGGGGAAPISGSNLAV